jgi:hypothetical protein
MPSEDPASFGTLTVSRGQCVDDRRAAADRDWGRLMVNDDKPSDPVTKALLAARIGEEEECKHSETALRWKLNAAGRRFYVRQCFRCGRSATTAVSFATVRAETGGVDPPPFDRGLLERAASARAIKAAHASAEKKRAWWEWYEHYLQSEEWQQKRQRVLERANFLCEGCREQPAVQVHHLTYDHVGREFLFELVAVCGACHALVHDDLAAGDTIDDLC